MKKKNKDTDIKDNVRVAFGESAPPDVPPTLIENPDDLKVEAAALQPEKETPSNVIPIKRGRGRHPKGCNCGRCKQSGGTGTARKQQDELPHFPVEALALLHKGIWDFICTSLQSEYRLSKESADEMGKWADLCIRQYISPMLGDYYALAGYSFTQITALGVAISLRKPKPKATINGKTQKTTT